MNPVLSKFMTLWSSVQTFLIGLPLIGGWIDFLILTFASFSHFGSGQWVASGIDECERPIKPLKLYEYEFCPYCRKVRETLNVLDLDCIIYPCPRETLTKYGHCTNESRYRNIAIKLGGKAQFPLLIDENHDNESPLILYESDAIINYLWEKYGSNATPPPTYKIAQLSGIFTIFIGNLIRCLPQHGLLRVPSHPPKQNLELWEFEPSPFCKRVREALTCLELPYLKKSAARGSRNRKEFKAKYGHLISVGRQKVGLIQVPLLIDPNTNEIILESNDIVKYLYKTYQSGKPQFESWDKYQSKKNKNVLL